MPDNQKRVGSAPSWGGDPFEGFVGLGMPPAATHAHLVAISKGHPLTLALLLFDGDGPGVFVPSRATRLPHQQAVTAFVLQKDALVGDPQGSFYCTGFR